MLPYCFDLIAYCNSALSTMNSTFSLTCADDGSVNAYVYVCVYVCKSKASTDVIGIRQTTLDDFAVANSPHFL